MTLEIKIYKLGEKYIAVAPGQQVSWFIADLDELKLVDTVRVEIKNLLANHTPN